MAFLNPRLADLSDDDRRVPEQFGRYRIIKRLGQGGMGSVYLAQDTHLERPVALKVPDFGQHEAPEARRRFLEEARTAATLHHPYLCRVYDAGEIDGQPYLTMAYIEGQSLAALIGDEGWPQRQVAALVGKLALALQEAHTRKVIHRDLKPANVMIKTTGGRREPVIVDFGLARRDNPQAQRLTRSGQIMGTLGYMAPEQIRGDLKEVRAEACGHLRGAGSDPLRAADRPAAVQRFAVGGGGPDPDPGAFASFDTSERPRPRARGDLPEGDGETGRRPLRLNGRAGRGLDGIYSFLRSEATPTASGGPPPSSSPTSGKRPPSGKRPQPAGSDSLVHQFLGQLVENDPSPSPIPTLEPAASRAPLPERRRPPRPLIVAAAVLGILIVGRDRLCNCQHWSARRSTLLNPAIRPQIARALFPKSTAHPGGALRGITLQRLRPDRMGSRCG